MAGFPRPGTAISVGKIQCTLVLWRDFREHRNEWEDPGHTNAFLCLGLLCTEEDPSSIWAAFIKEYRGKNTFFVDFRISSYQQDFSA